MRSWKMVTEPSLDDLLEDEMMAPVMRSAGIDVAELRARLAETARRMAGRTRESGSDVARDIVVDLGRDHARLGETVAGNCGCVPA